MTRILAPRRILVAVALTATLGAASVLALGGSEQQAPGDLPATWGVPLPHAGDRGLYNYTLLDPATGRAVGREVPYLAFEQREEWTYDGHGRQVDASIILVAQASYAFDDQGDGPAEWAMGEPLGFGFDRNGTLFLIETSTLMAFGDDGTPTTVGGVPVLDTQVTGALDYRLRLYPEFFLDGLRGNQLADTVSSLSFCGARSLLQGAELPVGKPMPLLHRCELPYGGVDTAAASISNEAAKRWHRSALETGRDDRFVAVGVQALDGKEALALAGKGGRLLVWFTRDIPYPVQFAVEDARGLHMLRLREFSLGAKPLDLEAGTGAAPEPVLRPREPWGMVDDRRDAVFPAHDAWAVALEDGPLAAYLADHAEAAVFFAAAGNATREDGAQEHWWTFEVTDGNEPFGVTARRQVQPVTADLPVPFPMVPAPVVPMGEPRYTFDYHVPEDAPTVDRFGLGSMLPTVTSMQARAEAFQPGTGQAVPTLHAACVEYEDDRLEGACTGFADRVRLDVQAGGTQRESLDPLGLQARHDYSSNGVEFDGTGRALEITSAALALQFASGPPALSPAGQAPYEQPPDTIEVWDFPSASAIAGVGAFALLAGAGYLLWPLAKSGALAGYARVVGDDLLNHPQRGRIMALVEAQPGVHQKEIARRTGLAWGQTQHHVAKLVRAGHLVARPNGGYTCYFPRGGDRSMMAAAGALKADGAQRLLQAALATPGMSMGQLARAAGISESTAHHHLKRIEAAGLVASRLVGGVRRVSATPAGEVMGSRSGAAGEATAAA